MIIIFLEWNPVFLLAVWCAVNVVIHYLIMIPHWIYIAISAQNSTDLWYIPKVSLIAIEQGYETYFWFATQISAVLCTNGNTNPMGNHYQMIIALVNR